MRPYRACVGVALFNRDGLVFAGERIDTPGAWQMPQGGMDEGEDIKTAALRELREEIGTDKAEIIAVLDQKLRYDFPDNIKDKVCGGLYCGQEQSWIAARFTGDDTDISLDAHEPPEFSQWQWISLEKLPELIVPFKLDVYREVIKAFSVYALGDPGN